MCVTEVRQMTEAVVRCCSVKKVFTKIFTKNIGKTAVLESLFEKVAGLRLVFSA